MAGDVGSSPTATTFNKSAPSQNVASGNPSVGTPSGGTMGSGKGAGDMRPQQTAMGTPIVYGNTYLPNPVNAQLNASVPVTQSSDTIYDGGGGGGDGGFADGTMSVQGYARGTTGAEDDDPWNWTKKEQVAPLSASIKPSEAVIPQAVPDQTERYLSNQATAMGTNAAAKGIDAAYKAYNAPLTTNAITSMGTTASGAPVALGNVGALVAPTAAAPTAVTLAAPATGALAPAGGLGLSTLAGGAGTGIAAGSAAPIGAGLGASLGAVAPVATTAGTAATTTALGTSALAGGEAMLAAMGPVGMVIGGALLAKKLGIF